MIESMYDSIFAVCNVVAVVLFVISLLRVFEFVYKYAKALPLDPKDDMMYSMYSLRIAVTAFTCIEAFAKGEDWEWVKGELEDDIFTEPVSSHPGGIVIDIVAATFSPLIIGAFLPLLLLVGVVGVPLQMMHLRAKQKQQFVDKLRGEHIEE